jgi:hypothetical protein
MGEGAQEPFRLEYRAGSGCPDEASFLARVQERTERARRAGEGEQARTFRVELGDAPHPSGTATVVDGACTEGTRSVDAGTCDEVADALSLIVALALDPHAHAPPGAVDGVVPVRREAPPSGEPFREPVTVGTPHGRSGYKFRPRPDRVRESP